MHIEKALFRASNPMSFDNAHNVVANSANFNSSGSPRSIINKNHPEGFSPEEIMRAEDGFDSVFNEMYETKFIDKLFKDPTQSLITKEDFLETISPYVFSGYKFGFGTMNT